MRNKGCASWDLGQMHMGRSGCSLVLYRYTIADVNVNAPADQAPTMAPPTHILKHTNLFRAFTASSTIPSIYIQQFWDNVRYDKTARCYKCKLDEQWFDLTKDTLRDALQITPVNNNNAFSSPSTLDALINFVQRSGLPERKTLGFERLRALVLQILWGVVNQAHINYAERIWEEFTQSIHTFIKDKKNLAQHAHGKKKATFIVIPSISAKGTKREFFGMPILDKLITADIQGEPYYKEYLEKVAKHQRYLSGEKGSDPDSPALKPAKATKKSKPSAPKVDLRLPVTEPASSQQLEPKPTPAKSQGKKRKLVTKTSDKPSPAKRFKPGLVTKRRKPTSSLRSVDESVDEGPLPPVVIREPDSGKYQPLPEVQGKGKEKVSDEQVALDLLTLQTPKKKSPADQFLFQRRIDAGVQDEGQAGPNPGEQDEGQAGPNLGDAAASQPQSSLVVHDRPNLEHKDLEATDVSTQPYPEQMDKGFTTTAYPNIQENLKLTIKKHVILEEHASSTGTLSSLQHLAKDLGFGDLFFNDKPFKVDNEKTTTETEAELMVYVTIQQDTSAIPSMTTPIIDLTSRLDSPNVHRPLQETATETTTTITTTHPPPPQPQQSTTDSMLMKRIGELEQIIENLIQDNKHLEERLDSHGAHHMMLYKALEKSMNRDHTDKLLKDLAEARKKKKKRRDSPKMPPGLHLISHLLLHHQQVHLELQDLLELLDHHKCCHHLLHLYPPTKKTTNDTRLRPSVSSTPEDLHMDDDMAPDAQVHSSDDEDIGNAHIPKASALASTYSPPPKDSLLAQTGDMAMFIDWFCKRQGITELKPQDLKGPAFELVKVFHPNVTIQSDFFFNKDLEYLRYDSPGSIPALSISKMKAAYYPDVSLEQMLLDQMWIKKECKYDIAAIDVRTYMRILSVVRIEVFSTYGYDYIKKIVLRRADLNEHIIAKRDFKYMYPSDFENLYLLNLQGHLNHLPPKDKKILTTAVNLWARHLVIRQRVEDFQLRIESYQTQLNLTKPRWDATGFEYKHDYTVINSPRAVTFRDKYGVQMIMRFNEIHKFNDGTLYQIDEALDYQVKKFKVNRINSGLNTRFWTRKDVDRSKEFIFTIQKRLKTRRIFRNLESFVGGRVRDGDYRLLKRTE
nr:hypothetical protein [Tanacetum cinerariifolium]